MSENEKLRALLAESRESLRHADECEVHSPPGQRYCNCGTFGMRERIDAALAEPPTPVEVLVKRLGELAEGCDRVRDERDEARADVERLRSDWSGPVIRLSTSQQVANDAAREGFAVGFRRGAEAMREAAILAVADDYYHQAIRALPIPEDK